MNLLALDASTEYLSLALRYQGQIWQLDELAGQSHSQIILPRIQSLLAQAEATKDQIEGIVFGAGPGSFTGLRISCGIAQGLAFGLNIPVIGISNLLALAHASGAHKVLACLDARMGEVYYAGYQYQAEAWQEVIAPALAKPEALPALADDGWVGAGSGWDAYSEALLAASQGKVSHWLAQQKPLASAMLELAQAQFAAGAGLNPALAAPIYIRNKVAFTSQERAQMALNK